MLLLRLFILSELVASVLGLLGHGAHGWLRRDLASGLVISLTGSGCLMTATFAARFRSSSSSWFVFGVLAIGTALALVIHHGFVDLSFQPRWQHSEEGLWILFVILFAPLLVLARQGRARPVLAFALLSGAMDYAIARSLHEDFASIAAPFERALVWRTFVLLGIGFGLSALLNRLNRANRALRDQSMAIAQLSESRERIRIARELHDTLAHSLSGLAIQLEAAESVWERSPDRAREIVSAALTTTREGLGESRRAIQNLRASPLESLGLTAALDEYARSLAQRSGHPIQTRLQEPAFPIPEAVSHCLFRIGQEALENAVRHSKASAISIELRTVPTGLDLVVQDDGEGFDPARHSKNGRFGLAGIRERAQLVGAVLEIGSAPGHGCRVALLWRGWA